MGTERTTRWGFLWRKAGVRGGVTGHAVISAATVNHGATDSATGTTADVDHRVTEAASGGVSEAAIEATADPVARPADSPLTDTLADCATDTSPGSAPATDPAPACLTGPLVWHLTADRVEEWRDIRAAALADCPEAFDYAPGDAAPDLADSLARLAQAEIWAAGDRLGHPLAVAAWEPGWTPGTETTGWITSVYARPKARGRGLVAALLARIAARAGASGMDRLGLHVGVENRAAQATYVRAGFLPSGAPFVNEVGMVEIAMTCPLAAPRAAP